MLDNNGLKRSGYVLEIKDNTVVMDFNHPLSGKDLFVSGSILSVREITKADTNISKECGCGPDGDCENTANNESRDDNCEVCGNPPPLRKWVRDTVNVNVAANKFFIGYLKILNLSSAS